MGSRVPVEEGWKGNKNNWDWEIRIDKLSHFYKEGVLFLQDYTRLPILIRVTTGAKEQEFELLDKLTTDRGAFGAPSDSLLHKILKNEPDGFYRLVVYKQAQTSKMYKTPLFGYWGQCVISKNKDMILWETRYFYCGALNQMNLETRDPREETRRANMDKMPGGGIDYPW